MSDQSDPQSDAATKPWTIKAIPWEARNAAISAAEREGQTIGEWLTRAIRVQVQSDRQRDRAPAVIIPETDPKSDLGDIERMIALAAQLATATGAPPPKGVSRVAYGLLRERLEQIKGQGLIRRRSSPTETPSESDPTAN